jgi:hypothetical protein
MVTVIDRSARAVHRLAPAVIVLLGASLVALGVDVAPWQHWNSTIGLQPRGADLAAAAYGPKFQAAFLRWLGWAMLGASAATALVASLLPGGRARRVAGALGALLALAGAGGTALTLVSVGNNLYRHYGTALRHASAGVYLALLGFVVIAGVSGWLALARAPRAAVRPAGGRVVTVATAATAVVSLVLVVLAVLVWTRTVGGAALFAPMVLAVVGLLALMVGAWRRVLPATGARVAVAVAAAVALTAGAWAVYAPPASPSRVALPGPSASPVAVVRAYVAALDASDVTTAAALSLSDQASSADRLEHARIETIGLVNSQQPPVDVAGGGLSVGLTGGPTADAAGGGELEVDAVVAWRPRSLVPQGTVRHRLQFLLDHGGPSASWFIDAIYDVTAGGSGGGYGGD